MSFSYRSTTASEPFSTWRRFDRSGLPSMTVTVTGGALMPVTGVTESHTSHDDVAGVVGENSDGAPGMPTSGPCGCSAIWLPRTLCGLSAFPAISRADARFSAGYNLSPTRTYSAPESRSAMIGVSFSAPDGLMKEYNKAPRQITPAAETDATTASVCRRPGSISIRTRQRVNAIAVRRARNW